MKKVFPIIAFSLLLAGCAIVPREVAFNRGTPESLLDVSSEVVNVSLTGRSSVDEVVDWVNQDQPTRAELYCMDGDATCAEAERVLGQFGVPVVHVASSDNTVALVYERVLARDCENRYIDNANNPYNWNHPTFGCSVASNSVQMVSDKRQFVSPALTDYRDGEKSVQTYQMYMKPPKTEDKKDTLFQNLDQSTGGNQ
jgi:hypothetical protein